MNFERIIMLYESMKKEMIENKDKNFGEQVEAFQRVIDETFPNSLVDYEVIAAFFSFFLRESYDKFVKQKGIGECDLDKRIIESVTFFGFSCEEIDDLLKENSVYITFNEEEISLNIDKIRLVATISDWLSQNKDNSFTQRFVAFNRIIRESEISLEWYESNYFFHYFLEDKYYEFLGVPQIPSREGLGLLEYQVTELITSEDFSLEKLAELLKASKEEVKKYIGIADLEFPEDKKELARKIIDNGYEYFAYYFADILLGDSNNPRFIAGNISLDTERKILRNSENPLSQIMSYHTPPSKEQILKFIDTLIELLKKEEENKISIRENFEKKMLYWVLPQTDVSSLLNGKKLVSGSYCPDISLKEDSHLLRIAMNNAGISGMFLDSNWIRGYFYASLELGDGCVFVRVSRDFVRRVDLTNDKALQELKESVLNRIQPDAVKQERIM